MQLHHNEDIYQLPIDARYIHIYNSSIVNLNQKLMSRFQNLTEFECTNCSISSIENGTFSQNKEVRKIILTMNNLTKLRAASFEGLAGLSYLILDSNNIHCIDNDFFSDDLMNVNYLSITGNKFKCFKIETLENLPVLKEIDLSDNPNFNCYNALHHYANGPKIVFPPLTLHPSFIFNNLHKIDDDENLLKYNWTCDIKD